jgi:hypothetical protein
MSPNPKVDYSKGCLKSTLKWFKNTPIKPFEINNVDWIFSQQKRKHSVSITNQKFMGTYSLPT